MPESIATAAPGSTEQNVARVLNAGSIVGLALLVIGTLLLSLAGLRPLHDAGPEFAAARIPADLLALRPEGVLWVGLALTVALPPVRVAVALVGYLREDDRAAVRLAATVLVALALSLIVAALTRR